MQAPFTVPFAPEFSDLRDNIGLLQQVHEISGGRMIDSEPDRANLFDKSGVSFPKTHIPLTRPLLMLWLAVFLFDIAVRRIAVDFKAGVKKLAGYFGRGTQASESQKTLAQLKKTRKQVQEQFKKSDKQTTRRKHYEADTGASEALPVDTTVQQTKSSAPPAEEEKPKSKTEPPPEGHIQQLLKAKKKAMDKKEE